MRKGASKRMEGRLNEFKVDHDRRICNDSVVIHAGQYVKVHKEVLTTSDVEQMVTEPYSKLLQNLWPYTIAEVTRNTVTMDGVGIGNKILMDCATLRSKFTVNKNALENGKDVAGDKSSSLRKIAHNRPGDEKVHGVQKENLWRRFSMPQMLPRRARPWSSLQKRWASREYQTCRWKSLSFANDKGKSSPKTFLKYLKHYRKNEHKIK